MRSISFSDIGLRDLNEDAYYSNANLFIVCDGVGGTNYGEIASKLACSSFADYFKKNAATIFDCNYLNLALQYTIQQFKALEAEQPEMKGLSTTIVLIAFDEDGAIIAWLGDSRLYHVRNGKILFVTEDHSLVNKLKKEGSTDEEHFKNIRNFITKVLNAKTDYEFSFHGVDKKGIQPGDYFFLCTDGVLENITGEILGAELNSKNTIEQKAQNIFSLCEGKTKDNFTFQLIEI